MGTTSKLFDHLIRYKRHRPKLRFRKKRVCEQPILHRHKKAVNIFSKMVEEGKYKDAFKDSDLSDLAIVTIHNYDEKTIFEQSLDFLGVKDYTVLKYSGKWEMVYKFIRLLEFLEECEKPYVLCCDARDVVLTDDPAKIIPLFKEFECGVVFNSTMSIRGIFGYSWAMGLYRWTRIMANGRRKFPNAGVCVGEAQLMREICEVLVFYCKQMDGCSYFPNNDQDILRAIFPWFWPRMKIDTYNEIVYRN